MDRTELVPQEDYRFLYIPFSECSVDDDIVLETVKYT